MLIGMDMESPFFKWGKFFGPSGGREVKFKMAASPPSNTLLAEDTHNLITLSEGKFDFTSFLFYELF